MKSLNPYNPRHTEPAEVQTTNNNPKSNICHTELVEVQKSRILKPKSVTMSLEYTEQSGSIEI